jgi:uncharacterized protein (DUF849 family)
MNVLVVDVGGTHVKVLVTGKKDRREFSSGPKLTAKKMVAKVRALAADWQYEAVSIGWMRAAMVPDEVLLGGGNARYLEELPRGCRLGDNADALTGGSRLWQCAACAVTEKRS